ncbi:acyl-CoA N-acyltransferase [Xylariales sp. AK1849]|nr:acyl-CoA N-acyltransferase [Xylariales sp. AK1849]
MPTYKIEGCTVNDAAALARNNMSAWWTDPTWLLNWEDRTLEDITVQCTKRMSTMLLKDRTQKRHQKVVDAETGTVVGYSRWILPYCRARDACDEKEYMKRFSEATWYRRRDVNSLGDLLEAIMNRLMRGKEFLELEYLAVHPDYRGQGIATMLIESGIAECERLNVDIIVMAYKAAVGIYQRLGFEMLEHLIQDDSRYGGKGEFGAYFMIRNARKI